MFLLFGNSKKHPSDPSVYFDKGSALGYNLNQKVEFFNTNSSAPTIGYDFSQEDEISGRK